MVKGAELHKDPDLVLLHVLQRCLVRARGPHFLET